MSKKYRLFDNPRARIKEALDPFHRKFHEDFWALRDVNFEVHKGQTLGVIGRNGSGKSTLLQLITSILQPTSGTIETSGRIAALLELGAGFDPDFTGRQNVRQYATLLGVSAAEIEHRLPRVAAFADIGEFFDREVKTYSSGMFARLAFAAAMNVDAEILILDEILAVGDAPFQRRCFEHIRNFQNSGKTVLMVSHSLEAIVDNCDAAILLEKGRLVKSGDPRDVINYYQDLLFRENTKAISWSTGIEPAYTLAPPIGSGSTAIGTDAQEIARTILSECARDSYFAMRPGYNKDETVSGEGGAEIVDYRFCIAGNAHLSPHFPPDETVRIFVAARIADTYPDPQFGFALRRVDGLYVCGTNSTMRPAAFAHWTRNDLVVFSFCLKLALQGGDYFFDIGIHHDIAGTPVMLSIRRHAIQITVTSTPHFDGVANLIAIDE